MATYLASKYGCDKLVLVSPAFEYINPIQNLRTIKEAFRRRLFGINKIKTMMEQEFGYNHKGKQIKLKTYRDFIMLTNYCKRNTGILNVPVRFYHGDNDEIIPLNSSLHAYRRFICEDKLVSIIPKGRHMLLTGESADQIITSITSFLSKSPVKEETTLV
ncbi:TPA: alpha/beta hydrolase [bacterium]|nr:alpha/beta hydrolase [bacterium]